MTRTFTIKDGQTPTKEQLEEVKAAAKREIQFDEDAPELSPALMKAFQCSVTQRNRREKTFNCKKVPGSPEKDPGTLIMFRQSRQIRRFSR